jgi:cytochrome c-type biogenesis protein CcmH
MTLWIGIAVALVALAWAGGVWWVARRVGENLPNRPSAKFVKARWFAPILAILIGSVLFVLCWKLIATYPEFTMIASQTSGLTPPQTADASPANQTKQTSGDLNILLKRLEERMVKEPNDAEGWALLARSYMELKRYPEAATTYAKATEKLPNEAGLWVEYVDAEVMANDRKWTPAATKAIAKALKLTPENPKALWLAGTERFEAKDYKGAVKQWEVLSRVAPKDSEFANEIRPALVEAKALAEGRDPRAALADGGVSVAPVSSFTANAAGAKPADDRAALFAALRQELDGKTGNKVVDRQASVVEAALIKTKGPEVSGTVEVDPALRDSIQAGDTVFIFARAEGSGLGAVVGTGGGSNAPVAVARMTTGNWPLAFSLSDKNSMSPDASLSTVKQVRIVARISRAGDAKAATGDLEGVSDVTAVNAANIKVVIKRRIP